MFIRYNYFRQHNNGQPISDHKEFYKSFSNNREFGGDYSHLQLVFDDRFSNNLGVVHKSILRKNPKRLIDIGSGVGTNLPLSRVFDHVEYHAVDYAEKTVAKGKEIFPNVHFSVGDAFNLNFKDEHFDTAIISHLLIIYEQDDDRAMILNEAARVINQEGIIILLVWKDSPLLKLSILLSRAIARVLKVKLPEDFMGVHFSKSDMRKTLAKTNLTIDTVFHTSDLEGLNVSLNYLCLKRYRRDYKKETEASLPQVAQNPLTDIFDQFDNTVLNRAIVKPLYKALFKLFPGGFKSHSVYILRKK